MSKHRPHRSSRSASWGHTLPAAKSRMLKRNLLFLALTVGATATLALCSKAQAAGGAYVVDDGAINAPGNAMSMSGTRAPGIKAPATTA